MKSIVIADDHPLLLKGLADTLTSLAYTVYPAANGIEALEKIVKHAPDIAILDVEMPYLSGFEVIEKVKEQQQCTKFIILTSYKEQGIVLQAQKLAIDGYLLKEEPFSEIQKCIGYLLQGQSYFSKEFSCILEEQIQPQEKKLRLLSPSERTILRMIAQQLCSQDIAAQLSISKRTVEKHRSNIVKKFELDGPQSLKQWVAEYKGLL